MIRLTRLDGEAFVLNAELIRYVERRGDTFITLTTGERFVVAESMDQIVDASLDYQRQKHFLPPMTSAQSTPAGATLTPDGLPLTNQP
ncbi:MAG: flagellar FlbD family protein [Planctomycetota bacterium]